MEAKVDVQKLQMLNDRINQTIDALNQVRMSVHGLSHSTGTNIGYGPYGNVPLNDPYRNVAQFTDPYQAQVPFTDPRLAQGLGHTDPQWAGYPVPMGQPAPLGIDPFRVQFPYGMQSGLSHTASPWLEQRVFDIRARDPYVLAQSFPNIFTPFIPRW